MDKIPGPCNLNWIRKKSRPFPALTNSTLKLADLFSGCGGMTLGAHEAARKNRINLDISFACDSNKAAKNVYLNNFAEAEDSFYDSNIEDIIDGSIETRPTKNELKLVRKIGKIDVVVAGPPCQGNSNLNNHTRRNDPRNELYLKAVRFIELTKPAVFIIENVASVLHAQEKIIEISTRALSNIGYNLTSLVLNTSDFGLAQIRKRHLVVGVSNYRNHILNLDKYRSKSLIPVCDYIEDIINEPNQRSSIYYTPSNTTNHNLTRINYLFDNNLHDLPDEFRPVCHRDKPHSYKSCYGRMHWNKPAQTITSGFGSIGQGRFIHPKRKRVITPHEAARIQGFPDFFCFEGVQQRTELHTMIANAVPPRIIAIILDSIMRSNAINHGPTLNSNH